MKEKLKIVIVVIWFSEKMGYAESKLAEAYAAMGHDVHVVSANIRPYYNSDFYKDVYEDYIGPPVFEAGTYKIDNYTLHALKHRKLGRFTVLCGLENKLKELAPDIVQCFDMLEYSTMQIIRAKIFYGCSFKLFSGNHIVKSVFAPARPGYPFWKKVLWHLRTIPRVKLVNHYMEKCYSATVDGQEIAEKFLGVSKSKSDMHPLGVDSKTFMPFIPDSHQKERQVLRKKLGIGQADILCVYTGRFVEGKMPFVLAEAIDKLQGKRQDIKALFIGNGPEEAINRIKNSKGCSIHDFMPSNELPPFYRAADIGVWPAQESLSMLDAVSCGIPIIVSDRLKAVERVEGNGLTYEQGSAEALALQIENLADNAKLRIKLGKYGAEKIRTLFSWEIMAKKKIDDYMNSLGK